MYADSAAKAHELLETYRRCLRGVNLNSDNIDVEMRRPAEHQKRLNAEHIARMRLGISYEHFLQHGKQQLSEAVFRETELEIRNSTLGCYLITAGYLDVYPYIFTVLPDGDVYRHEHFAAIGTGYVVAEAALYQRDQHRFDALGTTLYNVYEAMRLGRIAPSVGQNVVDVSVIGPPAVGTETVSVRRVTRKGFTALERTFEKFGPKPTRGKARPLPSGTLEWLLKPSTPQSPDQQQKPDLAS